MYSWPSPPVAQPSAPFPRHRTTLKRSSMYLDPNERLVSQCVSRIRSSRRQFLALSRGEREEVIRHQLQEVLQNDVDGDAQMTSRITPSEFTMNGPGLDPDRCMIDDQIDPRAILESEYSIDFAEFCRRIVDGLCADWAGDDEQVMRQRISQASRPSPSASPSLVDPDGDIGMVGEQSEEEGESVPTGGPSMEPLPMGEVCPMCRRKGLLEVPHGIRCALCSFHFESANEKIGLRHFAECLDRVWREHAANGGGCENALKFAMQNLGGEEFLFANCDQCRTFSIVV